MPGKRACASLLIMAAALLAGPAAAAAPPPPLQPAHPTHIDWHLTPEQIASSCKSALASFDGTVKRLVAQR